MNAKLTLAASAVCMALVLAGAGCSNSSMQSATTSTENSKADSDTSMSNDSNTEQNERAEVENESDDNDGVQTSIPKETTKPTGTTTKPVVQTKPETKIFTMAEVQAAGTPANCLSAIDGKVYNLSAWIDKHPGGDRAILSICGKDGSAAFNGKHGGQMRPEQVLAGFQIGTLK